MCRHSVSFLYLEYAQETDGFSLAMAEMTTMIAAIYRKYSTTTINGFDKVSPGISGRYEVFWDETFSERRVSMILLHSVWGLSDSHCDLGT